MNTAAIHFKPETGSGIRVFLLIFFCFFLTSGAYLSWLYHLLTMVSADAADALTMIAGYTLQAAGAALSAVLFLRNGRRISRGQFMILLLLHAACMVPALLSPGLPGTIVFGLLMNLMCGMTAAFYLQELTLSADSGHRALLFGAGYAAASVAAWLLSLMKKGSALRSRGVLVIYLILTVLCAVCVPVLMNREPSAASGTQAPESSAFPWADTAFRKFLLLACTTVFLVSLVKNIGFSFPSSDILGGVSLELSRIFYAAGLLIVGIVSDKSRRSGAACVFASLVIPFITLALSGEQISGMIFWCLDYFVFAFFVIYRIILFSDAALEYRQESLAVFGLLFGRLGDAAGTGIYMLFSHEMRRLIMVSALLFLLAVFLFFRLYQRLYFPALIRQKSEQEVFEHFAQTHDLSTRERTILRMILDEQSNARIAEKLFLSESTVKYHIHNLLHKTACKNRMELLALYNQSRSEN